MKSTDHLSYLQSYINKIPALPSTVTKVIQLCNHEATTPMDLKKIISLDPVLTGKILQLINSAYYGFSQEITSLVSAIIMMGMNTVKHLVLNMAILSTLNRLTHPFALNLDKFWAHSLGVAVVSKWIAEKRNIPSDHTESYFIIGLLHDIGKIVLSNQIAQRYLETIEYASTHQLPLYIAENNLLQFNHTDIGKLIVERWKLSSDICDTITYHHQPFHYTGTHKDQIYTVILANSLINMLDIGFSGNAFPEDIPIDILEFLDIDLPQLDKIESMVFSEIDKAKIFLTLSN
ncbi:MAG: HDOD domain-containing protein [Desulfobacterales bacterium]|nr:HDOD domain-containing protein [Desulfobacterales bacterium]